MISEVSICNQALSWVGADMLSSLDEPGATAQWCKNNYDFIRDAVLEERMWTFATARDSSTSGDKDEWGQKFKHRLPEEWLAVYRVFEDSEGKRPAKWVREGQYVLSDCATVYLWGLQRIVDTNKFTNLFVQAVAARMAAEMAIPFTENRQLQADLWGLYQQKLADAAARDGQQGRNEFITQTKLTGARLNDGALIGAR
jgi:hypothetical protein